jgi:peptidoglycan/xylan/chitin deacetylase (PgdA/CDA1 family)
LKNIVLTLDYELFFGKYSGCVEKCMIEPIHLLIELFDKYDCKMTIFWDVLHYIKAKEFGITNEVIKIENSIQQLIKFGHDVQLHIHSHWIDANYLNGKWLFPTYEHYNLQSFNEEEILNIVTLSKKTIENLTNKKVYAFRAGGWQIEPFEKLKKAFLKNEIFVDSSVAKNKKYCGKIVKYDFVNYPIERIYKFSDTPKIKDENGKFIEYQIETIKLPNFIIFYAYLKKLILKNKFPRLGDGRGIDDSGNNKFKNYLVPLKRVLLGAEDMLSLEFTSEIIFKYMISHSENNSLMIGHPKNIGYKHIEILDKLLSKNEFKFVSLKEALNQ